MKDTYQNEFQKEKKMLSLLFTICIIWFVGKFFVFGLRASWGIMKLLCTVIFFPVILIGKMCIRDRIMILPNDVGQEE